MNLILCSASWTVERSSGNNLNQSWVVWGATQCSSMLDCTPGSWGASTQYPYYTTPRYYTLVALKLKVSENCTIKATFTDNSGTGSVMKAQTIRFSCIFHTTSVLTCQDVNYWTCNTSSIYPTVTNPANYSVLFTPIGSSVGHNVIVKICVVFF